MNKTSLFAELKIPAEGDLSHFMHTHILAYTPTKRSPREFKKKIIPIKSQCNKNSPEHYQINV